MRKIRKMNKWEFVPVCNGSIWAALAKQTEYQGKKVFFGSDNPLYSHGSFLINPYHTASFSNENVRDDVIIFSDSGGLQQLMLEHNNVTMSPQQVVDWQEEKTNVGFCLDEMPFKIITDENGTKNMRFLKGDFEKCAIKTGQNIEEANKFRAKPTSEFMFYGIIQGRNHEEYSQWYNIIKDSNVDGYCVKAPTANPLDLAVTAAFAYENLQDYPVHFLGVGNTSRSLIPLYLSFMRDKPVSFDSSSYCQGEQYRNFLLPQTPGIKYRFTRDDYKKMANFCSCPICHTICENDDHKIFYDKETLTLSATMISVHNLTLQLNQLRLFEQLFKNKDTDMIKSVLTKLYSGKLLNNLLTSFDFLDGVKENGYEKTYDKYKHKIQLNDTNIITGTQKTMSGFW